MIEYITIASEGDAIDFGDLTVHQDMLVVVTGSSSSTRGLNGWTEIPANLM